MKFHNVLLDCLVSEFEIRIYKAAITAETDIGTVSVLAYIVADEASGFIAENEDGTRNDDVTVCGTLNEALVTWKAMLHRAIDNFSF